jgi:tripartite ATP-independent transporter DctM subunit
LISLAIEAKTVLIVLSVLVLLASGFPVAFSLLAVTILGYLFLVGPQALYAISTIFFNTLTTDIFVAVPMFIFMAAVFESSGIGDRLYDAMYKWMSGLRGGLAMGTVILCTLIAAIAGLVGTSEVTMGLLAYPGMRKRGYGKKLAIGCILGGGCLGPLIPPSVPMILVSSISGVSSGKLFITGVFPGLMCSFLFCLYIGTRCSFDKSLAPVMVADERPTLKEKISSLKSLIAPLLLIFIVLGGIYTGAFTPSEAGGIGAAGSLLCASVMRTLNLGTLWKAISTAFRINAMVMWLALAGSAFSSLAGSTGVNVFIGNTIASLPLGTSGILVVMLGITLLMGCFIDTVAIIMINLPIMMPVAVRIGVDPLLFAFLFTMCLIVGMITPPFGYALFYFKGLGFEEVSMEDIYKSVLPYVSAIIVVLGLCFLFPSIPLWLAERMIK